MGSLSPQALLRKVWPPMLATLARVDSASRGRFRFEVKYDGFRALAALVNGNIDFRSRNALDFQQRFPAVAQALTRLRVQEAVLDGELVAFDQTGVSRFQLLQQGRPTEFRIFDLLWLNGHDLRQCPLEERRALLEALLKRTPKPLQLAQQVPGPLAKAIQSARSHRWEGLIAKAAGSTYQGRRSTDWLKLKLHQSQEVAVVGYTQSTTGAQEIGALLLGVKEGPGYRYVGRVGTGFSQKQRHQLFLELAKEEVPSSVRGAPRLKGARYVHPTRVAQVAFSEWTADGLLRQPSFLGFRQDKLPAETRQEH